MREDWKIIQSDSILWAHKISFKQAEDTFQNSFQIEFKLTPYFWKLYFFYSAQLIQKLFFSDKIPMTNFFSQKCIWFLSQYTSGICDYSIYGGNLDCYTGASQ